VADTPAAEPKKSSFGFLTRKIGPVPIWVIAVGLVGGYYWYTHYGPGASKKAAAAQPAGQRPQVIIVEDKDGRRGPPIPREPGPWPPPPKPPKPRSFPIGRIPGQGPPPPRRRLPPTPHLQGPPTVAEPVTAAAPMTAGDVYGDIPTASPDGTTYDSGYPSAAQMEGAYVPAG